MEKNTKLDAKMKAKLFKNPWKIDARKKIADAIKTVLSKCTFRNEFWMLASLKSIKICRFYNISRVCGLFAFRSRRGEKQWKNDARNHEQFMFFSLKIHPEGMRKTKSKKTSKKHPNMRWKWRQKCSQTAKMTSKIHKKSISEAETPAKRSILKASSPKIPPKSLNFEKWIALG